MSDDKWKKKSRIIEAANCVRIYPAEKYDKKRISRWNKARCLQIIRNVDKVVL